MLYPKSCIIELTVFAYNSLYTFCISVLLYHTQPFLAGSRENSTLPVDPVIPVEPVPPVLPVPPVDPVPPVAPVPP